jgi:hypothetical protein
MNGYDVAGPLGCAFADDADYATRRVFELADEQAQAEKLQQERDERARQKTPTSEEDLTRARSLSHFEDKVEVDLRTTELLTDEERKNELDRLAQLMQAAREQSEGSRAQ